MIFLRVFIPFALGYFLSYLFRAVNNVIAPNLVADMGLDAADLGLLTSTYFLTFAAFQLPLGILLDRFGPRRTEAVLLLFAALGAFLFAVADSTLGLIVGRAFIGFGVSACLMAAFKAFGMWFSAGRLPLINGCQMAAGGIGALTATVPVEMALGTTDWRGVFMVLAVLTAAVAVVIFAIVPERRAEPGGGNLAEQVRGFGEVFSSPVFWRIVPLTVTTQAGFISIQSLWSGPWLRDVAGLDRAVVADHLFLIATAMITGFIFIGAIAERLGRLGVRPEFVSVGGMTVFMGFQGLVISGWTGETELLWFLYGFFGTAGILPYATLPQSFAPRLSGRVITAANVLVFVLAFAGQWGVGAVIDLWPETATGYAPAAYRVAFGMVVALQVAALAWWMVSIRRRGFADD
jgi:MFS family permease